MKAKIDMIHAHEILDSRGNPTLNVTVMLKGGFSGSASVPSGASTGVHEAHELRDGDLDRYRGKGVLKAVRNVNGVIQQALKGRDAFDQIGLDDTMKILDGTPNKHRLGANAILGVSIAAARAGARMLKLPLYSYLRTIYNLEERGYKMPTPLMNVLNGGAHADTNLDMQEFIVIPHAFRSFREKLRAGTEVYHALGDVLRAEGLDTDLGNEGGYAPDIGTTEDALKYLKAAVKKAKYRLKDIGFGIDVAASEFYDAKRHRYVLKTDRKRLTADSMTDLLESWTKSYPLMSIEDPLDQDAWEDWTMFMKRLGKKVLVIGDDLYVTNVERIKRGIEVRATNAVLIKMNQIGTLTETMRAIQCAKMHKQKIVISHRSGETSDTTIADLAVAVNAEYIKTGAPARSERLAKYNRLLEIEEELKFG
ncbi:MAG: phosphopyruvate hydratase [bacterium]|nr:phosphopyruvate hydratase [bacterium]MDA1024713.1 phosphopyruvate hydratase [bacterium]